MLFELLTKVLTERFFLQSLVTHKPSIEFSVLLKLHQLLISLKKLEVFFGLSVATRVSRVAFHRLILATEVISHLIVSVAT